MILRDRNSHLSTMQVSRSVAILAAYASATLCVIATFVPLLMILVGIIDGCIDSCFIMSVIWMMIVVVACVFGAVAMLPKKDEPSVFFDFARSSRPSAMPISVSVWSLSAAVALCSIMLVAFLMMAITAGDCSDQASTCFMFGMIAAGCAGGMVLCCGISCYAKPALLYNAAVDCHETLRCVA